jgi:hypothetical protein
MNGILVLFLRHQSGTFYFAQRRTSHVATTRFIVGRPAIEGKFVLDIGSGGTDPEQAVLRKRTLLDTGPAYRAVA